MRKVSVLFLLILLVSVAAAEVQYSINANEDRVYLNSTVELDCESTCPGLTWLLPDDAEVLGVRDGRGEIDDYEVSGNEVSIPGRRIGADNRVIEIRSRVDRDAEEIHSGLYKRTLRLSGFDGERITGIVESDNLISGRTGFGFKMAFSDRGMAFRGEGPVNIRMKFGDGYETEYFVFFGDRPSETEIAYEIPVGTLGILQGFRRFPVAVHSDDSYDRKVNRWSSGEYVSGAIQIRSEDSIEEDFIPVLAHEVVHGLNDRELNWDHTRSSYFDEGTGKYVEFLVKKKLYSEGEIDEPTRELFGEEVTYTREEDGTRYRYTLPPKGDREQLWNYYQDDRDFMKSWNAMEADQDARKFGYAYSELIIKNYIARMNGSLRDLYRDIEVEREIESPEEKWEIYSLHLDMTPCEYGSRERFNNCLEEINEYSYPVYSAKPSWESNSLDVARLKVPNRTTAPETIPGEKEVRGFMSGFLDYWFSKLQGLIASL